jgi:hypothetical protein
MYKYECGEHLEQGRCAAGAVRGALAVWHGDVSGVAMGTHRSSRRGNPLRSAKVSFHPYKDPAAFPQT